MAYGRNRTPKTSNTTVVVGEKRAARRARRSRGRKGGFGVRITTEWLIGFAAAFAVPQNKMIDAGAMVVATAPVRGLGQARGAAMGYVCGQATQHVLLPQIGIIVPDFLGNTFGQRASGYNNVV